MEKLLTILFLFLACNSLATNYYINSAGSDANAGTSTGAAWQTITKVNAQAFTAGDSVFFNRGNTFYGQLNISHSGTSASHIYYGAYGTGANPIITGFTTLSGWTNETGGNYSVPFTQTDCSIGLLNGAIVVRGKTPNGNQVYTYQSHSGDSSLTSSSLTGTPNWAGAEVVYRNSSWIVDRSLIKSQSTGTLIFSKAVIVGNADTYNLVDGSWFFIQNSLGTLDTLGEFYSNGAKFYMYFGAASPTSYTVQASSVDYNINVSANYVDISNIDITGASVAGLYCGSNTTFTYKNSNSSNQGGFFIKGSAPNTAFDNLTSDNSLAGAILINVATNVKITNTTINHTGLGMGNLYSGDGSGGGGISLTGNNDTVQNCVIKNSGYDGIDFNGNYCTVNQNRVDSFENIKNDGAAIYFSNVNNTQAKITNNIVSNGVSTTLGVGTVAGIYIDNGAHGATITGNTSFNNFNSGIYLQANSYNDTILNNTCFNNVEAGIKVQSQTSIDIPKQSFIEKNIFVANDSPQVSMLFYWVRQGDIDSVGTIDSNYYVGSTNHLNNLRSWEQVSPWTAPFYTVSGWQTFIKQDAHSQGSAFSYSSFSNLKLVYNATTSPTTIPLSYDYRDVKNNDYNGSITLQPYTSAVLIQNGSAIITSQKWIHFKKFVLK